MQCHTREAKFSLPEGNARMFSQTFFIKGCAPELLKISLSFSLKQNTDLMSLQTSESACSIVSPARRMDTPHSFLPENRVPS
jgi:hypothetical protein